MSDPVADALIRIKNGYLSYKEDVVLPYSKLIWAISELLQKEGYIVEAKETKSPKNENIKQILVSLKYDNRKRTRPD